MEEISRLEDEHLEGIWLLEEKGLSSRTALAERMGEQFFPEVLTGLEGKGYIEKLHLTEKGREYTSRLIRAHRLAERLLNDVLGIRDYEVGACEFEHIMNREILDGLCTLLGHPTQCPHGLPIPPGECCLKKEKQVSQAVHDLLSLSPGETLKVLYIQTQNDRELHILEGMQISPGKTVKVHQTQPALVIEVEGTHIALDESIGEKIFGLSEQNDGEGEPLPGPPFYSGRRQGLGRGMGRGPGRGIGRRRPVAGRGIGRRKGGSEL
ncbi:MAG: metal-dependent transcriptional regulator [Spirochaetales bacterium]|nr:metal-dependent transcriptional regulator [Spirochaetales bacterium]